MSAIRLASSDAMQNFGRQLAQNLRLGDIVLLIGTLGAGKTTLAQAIIGELTTSKVAVTSPTFSIMQTYQIRDASGAIGECSHLDLYRLNSAEELIEIGASEIIGSHLCLIEWPQKIAGLLPAEVISVQIESVGDGARLLQLHTHGAMLRPELLQLQEQFYG